MAIAKFQKNILESFKAESNIKSGWHPVMSETLGKINGRRGFLEILLCCKNRITYSKFFSRNSKTLNFKLFLNIEYCFL